MGPGSRVPIGNTSGRGPRPPWGPGPGRAGLVSDLGLLRSLRGRGVRHSCLVPLPLASLSSRDASRSARRKRTGCVEIYVQIIRSTRPPRYRRDRPPSRGRGGDGLGSADLPKGRRLSCGDGRGVDDSPKDLIRSTGEGSIPEVATFSNQSD